MKFGLATATRWMTFLIMGKKITHAKAQRRKEERSKVKGESSKNRRSEVGDQESRKDAKRVKG